MVSIEKAALTSAGVMPSTSGGVPPFAASTFALSTFGVDCALVVVAAAVDLTLLSSGAVAAAGVDCDIESWLGTTGSLAGY